MADCSSIYKEYKAAFDAYNDALANEFAAEAAAWGSTVAGAASGAATVLCWAASPETGGINTPACIAGTVATIAAAEKAAADWFKEELAEQAREAAEWWKEEMETAYCFCVENDGFDGELPEKPEVPDITFPDANEIDYPFDENEDPSCCKGE